MKTYTMEEMHRLTEEHIYREASILKQELREAKKINQLFL